MPNTNRPTISTHVLDLTRGAPAAGVTVTLWRLDDREPLGSQQTDSDGRIGDIASGQALDRGFYRMAFEVAAYYRARGDQEAFLHRMTLDFEITDPSRRYHIPLLMSPFSCASYRGS
ncbi:MAG: hydroxyisourate hydrolase [Gemmatimonadales bacterium]